MSVLQSEKAALQEMVVDGNKLLDYAKLCEQLEKEIINVEYDVLDVVDSSIANAEFNIDTIGAVLLYKKKILLEANDFSNRNLLKLYNGSGELAEKYGIVVEKYYNAFGVYNEERWE